MPLSRAQKEALWQVLSDERLRRAAEHNGVRGHDALSRPELIVREYLAWWRARHPLLTEADWAQLGGWPMGWDSQRLAERIDEPLVTRTYRGWEPWVEVYRSGRTYEARARLGPAAA